MPERRYAIQRLCSHHDVSTFRCDEDAYNVILVDYWEHVDKASNTTVFVLVDERSILGFVSLYDLEIEASATHETLRYLAVAALAVSSGLDHRRGAARLLKRAEEHGEHERRRCDYDGIACIPYDAKIESLLRRRGFTAIPDDVWWCRPF